jgi:hypothetical protein
MVPNETGYKRIFSTIQAITGCTLRKSSDLTPPRQPKVHENEPERHKSKLDAPGCKEMEIIPWSPYLLANSEEMRTMPCRVA